MTQQVRIRVDRRRDAQTLRITMTMPNGVQIPIEVDETKLPGPVAVGRTYECDWNGEFLNIRPAPLPALTPEDEIRLQALFLRLKGITHGIESWA